MKRNLLCREKAREKRGFRPFFMLLIIFCVQGHLSLSAQSQRTITLNMKQTTIEKAIIEIETATGYGFAYRANELPVTPLKDYAFRNATIEHVMNTLLEGTNMSWSRSGNIITIVSRPPQPAAGQREARGRVLDQNGNPLPGVTVVVKGDVAGGTASDLRGEFKLRVSGGSVTLVFSFIGKETQEVIYSGQKDMVVRLKDAVADVGQVVVTGIFNKAVESYTGAASTFTAKELESFGNRSLLDAIRNIDPSFNVLDDIEYGSDPNRLPNITMRGRSSMDVSLEEMDAATQSQANLPLFIVDGFEVSLRRVQDMDKSLVETVTLLKDASATALYGSRGANGIVVITTVQPKTGELRISYKGGLNIEVPDLGSYNLMNAREKLEYEDRAGIYSNSLAVAHQDYLELYNERYMEMERGVDTYWLKYPVRTGVGHSHSVRAEGGESNFLYAGNLGYNHIAGVMKGSKRRTTSANLFFQYRKGGLRIRNDLSLTFNNSSESPYGNFSDYTLLNPYETPYNEDGSLKKMLVNRTIKGIYRTFRVGNPLYDATLPTKKTDKYNRIENNFAVEWNILPELMLRGSFVIAKQNGETDNYLSSKHTSFENYTGEEQGRRGRYTYGTSSSELYEGSFTLNYNKSFGKHLIYAGLNYNFAEDKAKTVSVTGVGYPTPNMDNLGMAMGYPPEGKPESTEKHSRRLGGTINVNYTYDMRYFIDLSGKMEGSSKFGKNDKLAPFWSAGVGWNMHHEDFMKGHGNPVNVLRIRLSYGIAGSQNFNPYQALMTYRYFDKLNYRYWNGSYLFGMGNPDLGWQQTGQWNAGLETVMFNDRFRIRVDFYNKLTDDLLSDINLPLSSGFNSYKANVGKVRNRGLELSANVFILRDTGKGLLWSVGGSLVHNKNKILEISNSLEFLNEQLLKETGANPSFPYKEGQSMRTIFAVRSLGIDPGSGMEVFAKKDGTPTFTWDLADKVACGVEEPKVWGSLNTMFRYRGFSVNMAFSYRLGGDIYNNTLVSKVENVDPWKNADKRVLNDRWQERGDVAKFKSVKDFSPTRASSRFVMKENTFQCRSVNVSYEFGQQWLKKHLRMEFLSVGVYLEDLFRISTIKQERGTYYPFSHKYSLSVTARF